jgi:ribosomal protein L22
MSPENENDKENETSDVAAEAEQRAPDTPEGDAQASEAEAQASETEEQASEAEPTEEAPAKKRRLKTRKGSVSEANPVEDEQEDESDEMPAEELPKRAPARRSIRSRRRVVRAQARYVRTSARKARMLSTHLQGRSVQEARAILAFAPREVARDWSKLLESAVANAENNHELLEEDLFVRDAFADEGPTIKRFRPRAMGRATPIRKRTSHLTITLTPYDD